MATGTGKTVLMAMLIAWQTLNKAANPQDRRFSNAFLVVCPGITIRDRLRVLLPSDPGNYFQALDLVPADQMSQLGQARVVIANFHALKLREKISAPKLTKAALLPNGDHGGVFTETPDQMVKRVCRELGNKRNIVVLNDEAHHCYRRRPGELDDALEKLKGEERTEARQRDDEARLWLTGLEAINARMGIRTVYDLSATPFFLKGSGWAEGTLFPWVVSDFSLIDAIEAGLVKIPRVPVDDDSARLDEQPKYRNLWQHVRDDLPKRGRKASDESIEPRLPPVLQSALHSLYSNYEKKFAEWEATDPDVSESTPPVFIVVCNNTTVSKMVFDYLAGWEKPTEAGPVVVPGALDLFTNEEGGHWRTRRRSILIDSMQLESGEAMSEAFKKLAADEIAEFKSEYEARFPGRDAKRLTDEDLLREVMNTVGKPGKLGEHVRCVVSVSMLTEGWDANTVSHILGVRAFGTQLLCEQVVGRGLRRRSYVADDTTGHFTPEYAEVYGIPFSFIPAKGAGTTPPPPKPVHRVRALEDRIACEITFPRLEGYKWELPEERLEAKFDNSSQLVLSGRDLPTTTEVAGVVGDTEVHTLDDLRRRRNQEIAFSIAKALLDRYFREDDPNGFQSERPWLFPSLVSVVKDWMSDPTCLVLKDNAFVGQLALKQFEAMAVERIYRGLVAADSGVARLKPLLRTFDPVGSTQFVDFDTARPVWETSPEKCHVNYVAADTDTWEQRMAQALEELPEVRCYVKNQGLGLTIPYTLAGEQHLYFPDFIARIDDGQGNDDFLNLIVEVTGAQDAAKAAKTATARDLWVPAVNNHGAFGRWAFVEVTDPWDAHAVIRSVAGNDLLSQEAIT
jgi:type III restriction enzyme